MIGREAVRRFSSLALIGTVMLFGLAGCRGRGELTKLEMPETPVLGLRAAWAVVTGAYTRVYSGSGTDSPIAAHLRRGAVVEITDKSSFTDTVNRQSADWYQVRSDDITGWVFGAALDLYNTERRARNAAESLDDR